MTIQNLKKENKLKQKTLATYKYMMETPDQKVDMSNALTCPYSGKIFANAYYMRKHYERRYPDKDFEMDFPSEAKAKQNKEAARHAETAEIKANQEKLFTKLKSDLATQMTGSIKGLEKEITGIRSE